MELGASHSAADLAAHPQRGWRHPTFASAARGVDRRGDCQVTGPVRKHIVGNDRRRDAVRLMQSG